MLRSFRTTQTSAAFDFLFFALVAFPDILRKSQEEIDRVVGTDRLPDFTDEHKLPYISAIVKEILRWGAFVPTGIPHTNAADDVYKGYFIPKGSFIVPNAWYVVLSFSVYMASTHTLYFVLIDVLSTRAMLHDANVYPDPDNFRPERFLTTEGELDKTVLDPDAVFGFSRRLCPVRVPRLRIVCGPVFSHQ